MRRTRTRPHRQQLKNGRSRVTERPLHVLRVEIEGYAYVDQTVTLLTCADFVESALYQQETLNVHSAEDQE